MNAYKNYLCSLISLTTVLLAPVTLVGCMGASVLDESSASHSVGVEAVSSGSNGSSSSASSSEPEATHSSSTSDEVGVNNETDAAANTAMDSVMDRWNAVHNNDPGAYALPSGFTFLWEKEDQFPHPTFKLGTDSAYSAFGALLLAFLEADDNYDYLAENEMFTAELRYVTDTGSVLLTTSFEEMIDQLTTGTYCTKVGETTCNGLGEYAAKIASSSD